MEGGRRSGGGGGTEGWGSVRAGNLCVEAINPSRGYFLAYEVRVPRAAKQPRQWQRSRQCRRSYLTTPSRGTASSLRQLAAACGSIPFSIPFSIKSKRDRHHHLPAKATSRFLHFSILRPPSNFFSFSGACRAAALSVPRNRAGVARSERSWRPTLRPRCCYHGVMELE